MKKMLRYIAMMGIVGMLVGMLPTRVYAAPPPDRIASVIGYAYTHFGEDVAFENLKVYMPSSEIVQSFINSGRFPNHVEDLKALGYTDVDYSPVTGGTANTAPAQTETPAPEPAAFTVEDIPETPMWATSEVNYRNGASTDYAKVGSLKQNDQVTVNGKASTGWYRFVLEDGTEAYVSDKYLTTEDPNAATEPVEAEPEPEPAPEPEPVVETPEPVAEEPEVETPEPVVEEPVTQEPEQIAEPPVVEDETAVNRIPIVVGAVAGICVIGAVVIVLIRRKNK